MQPDRYKEYQREYHRQYRIDNKEALKAYLIAYAAAKNVRGTQMEDPIDKTFRRLRRIEIDTLNRRLHEIHVCLDFAMVHKLNWLRGVQQVC
jgi:hypothetical protein